MTLPDDLQEKLRANLEEAGVTDVVAAAAVAAVSSTPATAAAAVDNKPTIDPRKCERSYTFQFVHVAPNGERFEGQLTNNILTLQQQRLVGVLRAQYAGGVPLQALDDFTAELNLITAHMLTSLSKPLPKWLNFDDLTDERVLHALWKEVDSHEKTFRGPRKAPSSGA